MEIIFIRHAEAGEDFYLTKNGIKQAEYLAKRLKDKKFDEFYCSDMKRAKQTSLIVSKKIRKKPKIEKSLNEFETEILKKNKRNWNKEQKSHYNNLISFLKKISKKTNYKKRVLIIAHGLTNRIILSYFLDLNIKKLIQFRQRETAINSIYWVEKFKNWRLKYWNDNNHVPKKLRHKN